MAKSDCNTLGSRLIQIDTVEKLEHLRSVITEHPELDHSYWVDGYREHVNLLAKPTDDWHFSSGEKIPAEVWSDGIPNDTMGKCVQLWNKHGYILDDLSDCVTNKLHFICEK
ncbi:hypothetical protein ACF0H5_009766 [Mactra antiquata]